MLGVCLCVELFHFSYAAVWCNTKCNCRAHHPSLNLKDEALGLHCFGRKLVFTPQLLGVLHPWSSLVCWDICFGPAEFGDYLEGAGIWVMLMGKTARLAMLNWQSQRGGEPNL